MIDRKVILHENSIITKDTTNCLPFFRLNKLMLSIEQNEMNEGLFLLLVFELFVTIPKLHK